MGVQVKTHSPNLNIVPVDYGVDAHKLRPVRISHVKVRQRLGVWIGAPRAHEDGLDLGPLGEVHLQGGSHLGSVAVEVEVVLGGRSGDEVLDFLEGLGGDDVEGLEGLGRRIRGRRGGGVG